MSTQRANDVAEELRRQLRLLTRLTIGVYVALIVVMAFVYADSTNRREELAKATTTTNEALCELRHDQVARLNDAREFLAENPKGIPGIPASLLRQSIEDRRTTIKALSDLDCPPPELAP